MSEKIFIIVLVFGIVLVSGCAAHSRGSLKLINFTIDDLGVLHGYLTNVENKTISASRISFTIDGNVLEEETSFSFKEIAVKPINAIKPDQSVELLIAGIPYKEKVNTFEKPGTWMFVVVYVDVLRSDMIDFSKEISKSYVVETAKD
ncbi:hypothetical protein HYU07_05190 [Candidatus Woesearchaeota archaeon]|nr:hypothetical protein [Candidatus Woesearchaeota archaeon]